MNKDKTGNDRQARRREREKEWLNKNGYKSWESLHTALMLGDVTLQTKTVPTPAPADEKSTRR